MKAKALVSPLTVISPIPASRYTALKTRNMSVNCLYNLSLDFSVLFLMFLHCNNGLLAGSIVEQGEENNFVGSSLYVTPPWNSTPNTIQGLIPMQGGVQLSVPLLRRALANSEGRPLSQPPLPSPQQQQPCDAQGTPLWLWQELIPMGGLAFTRVWAQIH